MKEEQQEINQLFDTNSKNFAKSIENEYLNGKYARGNVFIKHINSVLKNNGQHILDFGCGTGRISLMLGNEGYQVEGVDPAKEHIQICHSINQMPTVTFNELDHAYVFKSSYYDSVVSSSVFEFVPDTQTYLNHIKQSLKSGGVLFISFPNLFSVWRLYAKVVFRNKYKHFQFQKNLLTHHQIIQLFKENGFEPIARPIHYESVLDKKNLGFLNKLRIFGTLSLYTFRFK